jgi:AraC family transcriptional activator of pobA
MKSAVLSVYFGAKTVPSIVEPHTHEYWQMEIVTQGVIGSSLLGEGHLLETGDMLLIPPGWEHEFMYRKPGVAWITLKFEREKDDDVVWGGIIRGNQFTNRLVSSFKTAIHGSANKQYEKVFVSGFLETMFHYILSDDFNKTDDASSLMLRQIEEKVLNRDGKAVTVNELAAELSYTRSHLSKSFKEITGDNLKAYIDKTRIRKVEEMLRYREHSITEIAADLGFNDIFSFSKFFKKHTGFSPKEFKRKVVERRDESD